MTAVCPVPTHTPAQRLRPVALSDWPALNALHRWAWFPERSAAGWAWMFAQSGATPGWVLEDDEGVCGFLGNIVQAYAWRGERRRAATGYSLIVLPRARGGSRRLLEVFRAQPHVFAVSIFNGNRRSAGIYPVQGLRPFPTDWADAKIVWPIRPLTIAAERLAWSLRRAHRPGHELFRQTDVRAWSHLSDPAIQSLDPVGDAARLDRYWCALGSDGRLLADRGSATLARRLADPDRTTEPLLLGWAPDRLADGELAAVALAQLGKMSELEAPILDIIDLTWRPDACSAGPIALITALKSAAGALQASRLRLPLLNAALAEAALRVDGALLRRRHTHAHVRILEPGIAEGWAPTPYDGDYGFALRPAPAATPGQQRAKWAPSGSAQASLRF